MAVLLWTAISSAAHGQHASGGGWIPSAGNPKDKATFGFDISVNADFSATGTLTYHDHGAKLNFHGSPVYAYEAEPGFLVVGGTYVLEPTGGTGTFVATLLDTGINGPQKGDQLSLQLDNGYTNTGTIGGGKGGGNITVPLGATEVSVVVFGLLTLAWGILVWRNRGRRVTV